MTDRSEYRRSVDAGDGITNEAEIETLVRAFYARIREDDVLGPIFNNAIGDNWEPHLLKMCDFWSSVMLTTGRYKGQPMRAHLKLKTVTPKHFDRWLVLFRETAEEVCAPETAERFVEKAARIAESLQLGMFFKPQLHDPEQKRACC
ncbi:group III truncated hemoglobin [Parvibaculum sp.]|uniref:group III truncated hemoglobin n=1 Tax=Parvibaculum sp. TaxID=2024848 RepID=UPI003BA88023